MVQLQSWEEFMIPILRVMNDGEVRHSRELEPLVARIANLSDEQKQLMLPSGRQLTYQNRIGWGTSYLTKVGALTRVKRAHYQMTGAGKYLLNRYPSGVTVKQVAELGEDAASPIHVYEASVRATTSNQIETADISDTVLTPIEQVQTGIERIHSEVSAELLERLQGKEPAFFEQAVVDLLLAMGYGGTGGTGNVTQLSNDGGIDGVIDQDILGLNRVYIQAKRYADNNVVGRPDLQAFVGALSGKADSGVFITTSRFSDNAKTYAKSIPTRIILIDGARLTRLMIRFGVGVQTRETYRVVTLDEDFFA